MQHGESSCRGWEHPSLVALAVLVLLLQLLVVLITVGGSITPLPATLRRTKAPADDEGVKIMTPRLRKPPLESGDEDNQGKIKNFQGKCYDPSSTGADEPKVVVDVVVKSMKSHIISSTTIILSPTTTILSPTTVCSGRCCDDVRHERVRAQPPQPPCPCGPYKGRPW